MTDCTKKYLSFEELLLADKIYLDFEEIFTQPDQAFSLKIETNFYKPSKVHKALVDQDVALKALYCLDDTQTVPVEIS